MSSNKDAIIFILKKISFLVSKLSDDEINDLLNGKITITLTGKKKKKANKKLIGEKIIENYILQLRTMTEREKGIALLKEEGVDKSFLKRLAKNIDIPTDNRDNIETLIEKIIEATIGYRLRSKAIQSNSEAEFLSKKELLKKKTIS